MRLRSPVVHVVGSIVVLAASGLVNVHASAAEPSALFLQVSVAGGHACGVTLDRKVECWGRNLSGELGLSGEYRGGIFYLANPGEVGGLDGVVDIAAGGNRTCALSPDGVSCWGLGYGHIPVRVPNLSGAVSLVAGGNHTCALMSDGTAKCWGANGSGQLGDGTITDRDVPVSVSGQMGVVGLAAAADHSCALLNTGDVACWGLNDEGQLGDGTQTNSSAPVSVSGLVGSVVALSAGLRSTCALMVSGRVRCWGVGYGESPSLVAGLSGATAVSIGRQSCAILNGGNVKCWGGEFGPRPTRVAGLTGETAIAGGPFAAGLNIGGTYVLNAAHEARDLDATLVVHDTTAPLVAFDITSPNGGIPNGDNRWFTSSPVRGILSTSDANPIDLIACSGFSKEDFRHYLGLNSVHFGAWVKKSGVHQIDCTSIDVLGNMAAASFVVKIDQAGPIGKIAVLPHTVGVGGLATISVMASDVLSGYTPGNYTCGALDTSTRGSKSVTCTIKDNAGNATVKSASYKVK